MRSRAVGMPSVRSLPFRAWGSSAPARVTGANRRALRSSRSPVRNRSPTEHDGAGCHSIDAGRPCPSVAPHPIPRNRQEGGIGDEVVEVIEPTMRIVGCPLMQLGLDPQYPQLGLDRGSGHDASVFTGDLLTFQSRRLRTRWVPSPCGRLSRPRTTTDPPSHRQAISRRHAFPLPPWLTGRKGDPAAVPTFTMQPFDGIGAQLFPCSLATATPQAFTVASGRPSLDLPGVAPAELGEACTADRPTSTRFEPASTLEGVPPLVPAFVHLSVSLAGPGPSGGADPSRRCQGCSHPTPRLQDQAALSFNGLLRQPERWVLSPHPVTRRLVAH